MSSNKSVKNVCGLVKLTQSFDLIDFLDFYYYICWTEIQWVLGRGLGPITGFLFPKQLSLPDDYIHCIKPGLMSDSKYHILKKHFRKHDYANFIQIHKMH